MQPGEVSEDLAKFAVLVHPPPDEVFEVLGNVDLLGHSFRADGEDEGAVAFPAGAATVGLAAQTLALNEGTVQESGAAEDLAGLGAQLALIGGHGAARDLCLHEGLQSPQLSVTFKI